MAFEGHILAQQALEEVHIQSQVLVGHILAQVLAQATSLPDLRRQHQIDPSDLGSSAQCSCHINGADC